MGASLARGLKALDPSIHVAAAESREEVRARAVQDGVADEVHAAPGAWLADREVVVLCTPVAVIEALIGPASRHMAAGAVLTDVGGAKERVVDLARREGDPRVLFVGAHPMFGGRGGYEGAKADRWKGGTVAVCTDGAHPGAVARVAALHEALGADAGAALDRLAARPDEPVALPGDAFGPCFRKTAREARVFELGFDREGPLGQAVVIRGLVKGSAAERAGVKEGSLVLSAKVPAEGTALAGGT
jgi:hypothetical protein